MTNDFYITSQTQLNSLIELIHRQKVMALDTEFTRQTTYYPILSIIQVAIKIDSRKQIFIIDCLSELDLREFFALIPNPQITKILHSSSQDLQIFHLGSGVMPQGIIDTQIMANFCGFGFNVGYSNLVKKIFGKELDKDQQRSNWQRRPLSKKQIEYALLDVEFLHEIHEEFFEILKSQQRQHWFAQEMQKFIEKSLNKSEENLLKNFSFRRKNLVQKSQLRKLVLWRENLAQKTNLLRQYFLSDEEIDGIIDSGFIDAKNHPRLTKQMISEINQILADQEGDFDFSPVLPLNEREKRKCEKAKELVEEISQKENFSAQFLLTSFDLKKIICQKDPLEKVLNGWRYELLAPHLKEIIF